MPRCLLGPFLTGWAVRPVDLCAGLPGVSEERRIHLQHPHKQESARSETRASSRGPDGGENKSGLRSQFLACSLQLQCQMTPDEELKFLFENPLSVKSPTTSAV